MRVFDKVFAASVFIFFVVFISTHCIAQEQPKKDSQTSDSGALYFIRNNNLWVYDFKTAHERQITHDKKITSYCISSNGRLLAYFTDADNLYIYDLISNKEDYLAQINTDLTNPSFSPSGDQIVMVGRSSGPMKNKGHFLSNTYGQYVNHVWLLDIKSKKLTDLTPDNQYRNIFANWSPDGKWISYTSFVDPWWMMFANIEWEVFVMDVNKKDQLPFKIGKGYSTQWIDNNKLAVLDNALLKVYDTQTKNVVKEFKLDDSCDSDFSIGRAMDVMFYKTFCGHEERRTGLIMYDLKSRKKTELIYDAENPTYIK